MRLDGGKKNSSNTSELYLWSQRLVDFLHQPSEGATIHGLGQGIACANRLLETERADHLEGKYLDFNTKMKTKKKKKAYVYLSIYKWPLLLWLWVSCEWVPPQGQSHQQPAAGKQRHICSWLHLLPGFGAYLNIQKYKQDCSDLRKIVDLRLGGDISFSLLSFSKLSVSKMEDAAHDTEQVLGKTANV